MLTGFARYAHVDQVPRSFGHVVEQRISLDDVVLASRDPRSLSEAALVRAIQRSGSDQFALVTAHGQRLGGVPVGLSAQDEAGAVRRLHGSVVRPASVVEAGKLRDDLRCAVLYSGPDIGGDLVVLATTGDKEIGSRYEVRTRDVLAHLSSFVGHDLRILPVGFTLREAYVLRSI